MGSGPFDYASENIRTAPFWVITQPVMVISYRLFRTTESRNVDKEFGPETVPSSGVKNP